MVEDKKPTSKQVYIFENKKYGILKIGISDNPLKRIKQVQGNSGFLLNFIYESEPILNPIVVERLIHKELLTYKVGGEWFNIDVKSAKETIERVLEQSIKGKYKDLTIHYQLKEECTQLLEYNVHKVTSYENLKEINSYLYEDNTFNYYVAFKQGSLERTVKFCNKNLALKFINDNLDRLLLK